MLTFFFKDLIIVVPFFIFFVFFWSFFIKNNFYTVRINPDSKDVLKNSKFIKKIHFIFVLNWCQNNLVFLFVFFFFLRLDFSNFWFGHMIINNFNFNLINIIIFIGIFLIFITKFIKNSNVNYNFDYFSSIVNLIIFVPFIFFSNTMFTFLFVLELLSLLILYKFSVSRVWFNTKNEKSFFNRLLPKSYLNMLFFQYWANFFSSMFIMFSLFNIIYIYGSSEWFFLNLINNTQLNNFYFNKNFFLLYILTSFFIGIFLKIGFTPLHLFKIEVYKGIPFISIFFYTTWYFLSFFLYFCIIIYYNLTTFIVFFNIVFFIFILIGLYYTIFLLFDVNLIKSFFAYSTIVNVMNFIIVLYLILV